MFKRHLIFVIVAVILVFILFNLPSRISSSCRSVVVQALSPLIRLEHSLISSLSHLRGSWASLQNLKEENLSLQEKVRKLSRERLSFRDLKRENRRLRRLLGFKDASSHKLLPSQVIGRDTMHWYSSIIIDKGLRDGVAPGMVVVSEGGVVGKVIESTPSTSKVLLVVDKQSRIGGIVQRTRGMGIIEGTSFNTCRLNYLSRQSEAQAGDKVLTSGLGGVYPKGLYIGEIIKVHEGEYGLYKYADVLPGVDFAKLEEVLVLAEKM